MTALQEQVGDLEVDEVGPAGDECFQG